jgi:S2P endopeptidase
MPGVNLPWNQLIHYFITLVICGVFHELGHALAAVTEQVRINGFGLFLMFLYPGAFVDLHPDHLAVISPLRQLRIYCAGIWHNIILTLSVAVLFFSLPYLSLPFYTTGQGAVVTSVAPSSALQDKLWPGITITSIDSCAIRNRKNWFGCLSDIMVHSQRGYCADKDEIKHRTFHFINETTENLDGGRECCAPDSQSDLCFVSKGHTSDLDKYICLTARRIVSDITCHTHDECAAINPGYTCLTPSLGYRLHLVKIGHTGPGDPILFTGDIARLQYSVTTTDYQSTYWPVWVPDLLETMCLYIGSISAALALMNILPAYALDGQWTLGAILEYWLPDHPWRNRIFNGVLMIVTLLLILNIVMAFCILISW